MEFLRNNPRFLWLGSLALCVFAFVYHLGAIPIWADEPTRAIVALEMLLNDEWVVPTIQGEYYYNKPPLYNWMLAGLFKLTGNTSELMVRVPALVPLFLFALTIFWWVRRRINAKTGFFVAAAFVTGGRMLLYESWLGHIDIFFSWTVFLMFIAIYECYKRERWWALFLLAYTLAAIGVMSKVISVVFLGLTLLIWFSTEKRFLKLFHPAHFVSVVVLAAIVASWLYAYDLRHPVEEFFGAFLDNNASRTAADKGIGQSILYAIGFPFEQVYNLLPWSLFGVFVFRKGFLKAAWKDSFLRFCIVAMLVNLVPYILSPDTRPRYLLSLYPLALIVIGHAFENRNDAMPRAAMLLRNGFLGLFALCALAVWSIIWLELPFDISNQLPKIALLSTGFVASAWLLWKAPQHFAVVLVFALLVVRMGWNWFTIPPKASITQPAEARINSARVCMLTEDYPLHVLYPMGLNHDIIWYLESGKGAVLKNHQTLEGEAYYLCKEEQLSEDMEVLYQFRQRYKNRMVYLVKLNTWTRKGPSRAHTSN